MHRKKRNLTPMQLRVWSVGLSLLVAVGATSAHAQAPPPVPNPSPFGPNVYVITPTMSTSAINALLNSLNQESQFSTNRYAVLFQPGNYGTSSSPVGAQVGYYEQVAGLGALPTGVFLTGGMGVDQLVGTPPNANMTQNFWRSMENLSEAAATGQNGVLDWGVSQGASLRRMNIQSNLWLANSQPINGENACQESSGGFMADSVVIGQVNACSQQQWYTRNSLLSGGFSGNVWNFVFSGVQPANTPNRSYPGGTAGDENVTNVELTPNSREKPFLHVDGSGNYFVFVPALQTDSSGPTWGSGQSRGYDAPISAFYIANPSSSITDINTALAAGMSLILTPGIYKYSAPFHVTQPGTVVLGMGFATIVPQAGNPGMIVEDVDNVQVAGLIFDAGPVDSPILLEVGDPYQINQNHTASPTSLNDIFFRIGGATVGMADTALEVDSGDVIMDNIWAWRADHGNPGTYGWTINTAKHGVVVNGEQVTALGLAVEHFQQEQTLWNGEGGTTIFYQSELPYDPPNQGAWSSSSQNGYPSYVVSWSAGCSHQAYGFGIYSYFNQNVNIIEDNAVIAPNSVGTNSVDVGTVFLNGSGQIRNVINGSGGTASSANTATLVPVTSFSGTAPCDSSQYALPVGSTIPLLQAAVTPAFYNPNHYDTPQIMNALKAVHPDLTIIAAHRGIHALPIPKKVPTNIQSPNVPENSIEAIQTAAHLGWEAAEVDLQSTSDNVPILSHDKTWGKEWCSFNPNLSFIPPGFTSYDPWTAPGDSANDAKNPVVTQTTLHRTRYWYYDNTRLRDSVNLVNDSQRNSDGSNTHGCYKGSYAGGGEYPPTLTDILNDMKYRHIHMVLFLDIKTAATANDIWNVLDPVNGQPPVDDEGRPFYQSVVFKMDSRNFPTTSDFLSTFPRDSQKVNFMPLFTSGDLTPPVPTGMTAPVVDEEDAGFDSPADAATDSFYFPDEAAMQAWLYNFENLPGQISVVAVEVVMKEPNGILTDVYNYAKVNHYTQSAMAVADFNAVGEFYPNSDGVPQDGNQDTTVTPQFYRSSNGSCCDYLTHYLYNNPDGDSSGSHRIDPSKPFDGSDQRSDTTFIAGLELGTINSDDPTTLAGALGSGRRNTCYLNTNYTGGPCSPSTTATGPANGTYSLTNVNSGFVMDVTGNSKSTSAAVDQYTANGGANQQWQLTSLGNGLYKVVSVNSGLCLDVKAGSTQAGATIDQYTCNASYTNQQFTIAATNDGNYTIVALNSGLAVEVPGSATEKSTVLDQYTINGNANQEWSLSLAPPPTGTDTLLNVNSGLAMDVTGGSTSNSALIDQYTSLGSTNQQWQLKYLSKGLYNLVSVKSGLCLDVAAGSTQKGAAIDQYTCNSTYTNQQFTLSPAVVGGWTLTGKGSGLVVEVPGSSTALSVALDQWTANLGKSQAWSFVPVN